ncbi:DUF1648 domain-containing protein [Streptosporangium pseudovulgare]|uniref:DUF1648 domain-containing protein n=1 Tax=Streptosporangium pseudovulgare TaxID=35765 RepID=A0ABQ2QGT7_9ACTN|nr:DUF1648 domain-containing protein [Streptosporangium pseudovulgare]GGP78253.1 hypothetical protein GCM10010140_03040 [Streptosporangium pseudovulgare]
MTFRNPGTGDVPAGAGRTGSGRAAAGRTGSASGRPGGSGRDRRTAVTVAAVWGALVCAALVAGPLALRDRLPDPLATHWGSNGVDGSMSFAAGLAPSLVLWGVAWVFLLVSAAHGEVLNRRGGRAGWWGFLAGGSVFALGVSGSILLANLDAADWRQAAMPGWAIPAVLVAALSTGVLAGYLGRGEPDRPVEPGDAPTMRLRPGRRAVWAGRAANRWMSWLSAAMLLAGVVSGTFLLLGAPAGEAVWAVLLPLLPLAAIVSLVSDVRVRVGPDGLRVGFGPFSWPAFRVPTEKIAWATAERRSPAEVGGWGLRGLPGTGRLAVMVRGGECLVVRRAGGGDLIVSVDDAERAAALLNAYAAEAAAA